MEIERKFLVSFVPENVEEYPHSEIVQGYLSADPEVRVRKKVTRGIKKFYRTEKIVIQGSGDIKRKEDEREITEEEFNELWPVTKGKRVEKTRYEIPHGSHTIELDVYRGNLEGLVTADVEFDSEDAAKRFFPPSWMGTDITADTAYKNQTLAVNGMPNR